MNISTRAKGSTGGRLHKKNLWPAVDMNAVRSHFVARGSSLFAWSRERGYVLETVRQAIKGQRRGPHSRKIINTLLKELAA